MRPPRLALSLACLVACSSPEPPPSRPPSVPDAYLASIDRPTQPAASQAPPPEEKPVIKLRPLSACNDTDEGFEGWLEAFRRHAASQGISQRTIDDALTRLDYSTEVISLDRSQKAFKLSFAQFSKARITAGRINRGKQLLRSHNHLLARVEQRFGVQPEVVVAIWGLETDYGTNAGSMSALRALATLAYDCRRADRFRDELLAALRVIERGDLAAHEMRGAWAGELGQTQFLPSSYERFAVDFDGDGKANLINSTADALASTANYLKGHGWRPREPYQPGSANFDALSEWNKSEVYRKTIALFASKLKG